MNFLLLDFLRFFTSYSNCTCRPDYSVYATYNISINRFNEFKGRLGEDSYHHLRDNVIGRGQYSFKHMYVVLSNPWWATNKGKKLDGGLDELYRTQGKEADVFVRCASSFVMGHPSKQISICYRSGRVCGNPFHIVHRADWRPKVLDVGHRHE